MSEWWDVSWNLAVGCTKVSAECNHCWALEMARRLQGMKTDGYAGLVNKNGEWTGRVNLVTKRLQDPEKWKKPRRVAVNLMGDLFHREVPISFVLDVFRVMAETPRHTYLVLTKRPEIMAEIIKGAKIAPLAHVYLGATAGMQQRANESWSSMCFLAQSGWNTWVSSEPKIEHVDWHGWGFLKWMVTGGESGTYARPMAPWWVRGDRDWCARHGVPWWFKQWGEWGPNSIYATVDVGRAPDASLGGETIYRLGRINTGSYLDGVRHQEKPRGV